MISQGALPLNDIPRRGYCDHSGLGKPEDDSNLLETHSSHWQVKGSEKFCRGETGIDLSNQALPKLIWLWNPFYTYDTSTLGPWVRVKGITFTELLPLQEACFIDIMFFISHIGLLSCIVSFPFYSWRHWGLARSRSLLKVMQLVNGGGEIWTLVCVTPDHIPFSLCHTSWCLSHFRPRRQRGVDGKRESI